MFIIAVIIACIIAVYINKKRILNNLDTDVLSENLKRIDIVLNMEKPIDEFKTIQLVSINNDNSATIKVLRSGNVLTTKSGRFFKGQDFGYRGWNFFVFIHLAPGCFFMVRFFFAFCHNSLLFNRNWCIFNSGIKDYDICWFDSFILSIVPGVDNFHNGITCFQV